MSLLTGPLLRSLVPVVVAVAAAVAVALAVFGANAVTMLAVVAVIGACQWLVAPWVVGWMLRPRTIPHDDSRYLAPPGSPEDRVARIVARRCASAGLPLVRLGVVETDTPNAFAYGRSRRSAWVVVTTGLLQRLSDDELDAVLCHELAHVRHRDASVMTFLGVVPLALYFLGRVLIESAGDDDDDDGDLFLVGLAVLAVYVGVELLLLSFSRAREHAADRWACEHTVNGEALASALVTVAQPMSTDESVIAEQQARRAPKPERRLDAAGAFGLCGPELAAARTAGGTHEEMAETLRAELSARRRVSELLSSHPSVARRIAQLERSGLPGAPRRWQLTDDRCP